MLTYRSETFGDDLKKCTWIFDLFAMGFDHISQYLNPDDLSRTAFDEPTLQSIASLEDQLIACDGTIPKELWGVLDIPPNNQLLSHQFLLHLFLVLQTIDRCSADLNYFKYGVDPSRWKRVAQHLHLNKSNLGLLCDGLVTIMPPRLGRPHPEAWFARMLAKGWTTPIERGIHHHRYFQNIARVAPIAGCNIRHFVLPARSDLDAGTWRTLKIGMVPMLHELELHAPTHAQCHPGPMQIIPRSPGSFSIATEPADSKSWDEILEIVEKALIFFAENGVQLVVFPELTVPDKILEHIKKTLRDRFMRQHAGIELVLAGTFLRGSGGNHDSRNVAVLLNGSGDELLRQEKMHPYEMQLYEQERYGLLSLFGNRAVKEDIECFPRELVICDSPASGLRIAILICEDSCHQEPAVSAVQQLKANLVLVPVMAGALLPERQFSISTSSLAAEPGAITIISNSAVLPLQEWISSPPPTPHKSPPLGIVGMPLSDANHRSKWFISNYIDDFKAGRIMIFAVEP